MTWTDHYHPPVPSPWQGRSDTPTNCCFFQTIKLLNLLKETPKKDQRLSFALLGFCCDEGVRRNLGRTGAVQGPKAIREALSRLPVQKPNIVCYDAGDIVCANQDLETAQKQLGEVVAHLLSLNITPILLGGRHEIAWGHYQGIAAQFPKEELGIVNFDAHYDMRPLLDQNTGSSGTPFLQIAEAQQTAGRRFDYNCIGIQPAGNIHPLFETAKAFHVNTILADDLHQGYHDKCVNFVDRVIDQNQIIYLTLCLDVFNVCYAPGVSAPQVMGLTPWQIVPLVRQLAASGKVVSYDIAELSPTHDIDQRTAKLAANFIYEIIHHHHAHSLGK